MPTFTVNARQQGQITLPSIDRANLTQDQQAVYPIDWHAWRVWDAIGTNLPATSALDDLGLDGGTFGTSSTCIKSRDLKTLTTSLYARALIYLPAEYDAGETVSLSFNAGMLTTVAATSCTLDAQMYESDGAAGIGSDLVTTSAQSINSLTMALKTFAVTSTTLQAGDLLDLRITVSVVDAATGTAVIALIGSAALLLDVKG